MAQPRPTGQVFLENFDEGLARTIGGELIPVNRDGELSQTYAVAIDGVTGPDQYSGLVPITMADAEDAYQDHVLPQIVIARGSITPQMNRWFPGGWEYQVPAANAEMVKGPGGTRMPSLVEKKWWTYPFEISYDVHLRARVRVQADRMLRQIGRHLWAYGQVFLRDSQGDERGYYAFVDSYESLGEISDVADRMIGHTVSIRVEGELDFNEPFIQPTSPKFRLNTGILGED